MIGIVAGFLGGVLITVIGQKYSSPRDRSADLMAQAIGDLVAAIHRNVTGKAVLATASTDAQAMSVLNSGSEILRATLILATVGTGSSTLG